METQTITRHINRLFLDPNNYRFVDREDYVRVPDDRLLDPRIQQRTAGFLRGQGNENILDLINSFKTNGILRQDPIQVYKKGEDYIAIEGNRRLTTLKLLYDQYKNASDVGILTEADFKSIPVVLITGDDPRNRLIARGLNHISGKRRWSPVNQARLIHDLETVHGLSEQEICGALGIDRSAFRHSRRTYALINLYKDSDYGDQFVTARYSVFEEVMKKPDLRAWLGWDDTTLRAVNSANLERLFSWVSTTTTTLDEGTDDERLEKQEPIITKSSEIRDLAKFINDPRALEEMEENRSVSVGYASSDAVGETRFYAALSKAGKELQTALNFLGYAADTDSKPLEQLRRQVEALCTSAPSDLSPVTKDHEVLPLPSGNLTTLGIPSYRRLRNLSLPSLRAVNLFVGRNNSGKTSLLEAVYLLTTLNDLNAFLDLEKTRGKFHKEFNAEWVDRNFTAPICVSGSFGECPVSVEINRIESDDNIERSGYVSTLEASCVVNIDGETEFGSTLHLYSNRDPEFFYPRMRHACRSALSSPYRYSGELLRRAHAHAVKEKSFDGIIAFIRDNIDPSIEKIELINVHGVTRFFVSSSSHSDSIDITKYGEGLQRIFEIALLVNYCRRGILLIDEIDSAVHTGLLRPFADFITRLARENDVQLFITTHSKECVDAFSATDTSRLMAYMMTESPGDEVGYRRISGERLGELIESIDLDIRQLP